MFNFCRRLFTIFLCQMYLSIINKKQIIKKMRKNFGEFFFLIHVVHSIFQMWRNLLPKCTVFSSRNCYGHLFCNNFHEIKSSLLSILNIQSCYLIGTTCLPIAQLNGDQERHRCVLLNFQNTEFKSLSSACRLRLLFSKFSRGSRSSTCRISPEYIFF